VEPINVTITADDVIIEHAQMTSNGFFLDGLDPFTEYDAGIICYQIPSSADQAYIRARNFDEKEWIDRTSYQFIEGMEWNPVVIRNRGSVKIGYRYYNFGGGIDNPTLKLTMKTTALAAGRTLNIYAGDSIAKYGDPEPDHYLIGTFTFPATNNLTGEVYTQEIPLNENVDLLEGKKGIYLEFLQGDAPTSTDLYNDVVNLNKIQFTGRSVN